MRAYLTKIVRIGEPIDEPKGETPEFFAEFWRKHVETLPFFDQEKEHLFCFCLSTKYHVKSFSLVSVGSLNESIAHPREIYRPAIVAAAYAVIVMHNHPSGDPSPSLADHSLTRRLGEAGELLQIRFLDHIIMAGGNGTLAPGAKPYFSFQEAALL